jgi:hypothetical protein
MSSVCQGAGLILQIEPHGCLNAAFIADNQSHSSSGAGKKITALIDSAGILICHLV